MTPAPSAMIPSTSRIFFMASFQAGGVPTLPVFAPESGRRGRGRAGTHHHFGGQTLGFHPLTAQDLDHDVDGRRAEPEFRLANGRERHAEIFTREHVSKSDERH